MRSISKRICAVAVTLTMLIGMMSVMAFPAAAEPAVEKFEANFSSLPAGMVNMTDTTTVDWLESRFAFYYLQEGRYFERPNVNGYVVDGDGNNLTAQATDVVTYLPDVVNKTAHSNFKWMDGTGNATGSGGNSGYGFAYWQITKNAATPKYLNCTSYSNGGNAYRKVNTMYVKSADGDLALLKNFNLEMDFMPADQASNTIANTIRNGTAVKDGLDSLGIFFRAKVAGDPYNATQEVVTIDPTGKYYTGIGKGDIYSKFYQTMTNNGSDVVLSRSKEYHLSLTAIGDSMTVTVKDGSTVIWTNTCALTKLEKGYLGIGGSDAGARYANIAVTRLNEDGNPIDFSNEADGYTFNADFHNFLTFRDDANYNYYNNTTGFYYKNNGADTKWL